MKGPPTGAENGQIICTNSSFVLCAPLAVPFVRLYIASAGPSYHASFPKRSTGDPSAAMPSSTFVAVASCLVALAHGYANPGSCSGACNVHDPGLIRRQSDGKYFRFSTGNKISYASSSSIEGPWTVLGSVLPSGSSINLAGNDDLWVSDFSSDLPRILFL